MAGIEVKAFGKLFSLFKKRDWPSPLHYELEKTEKPLTAEQLIEKLEIPAEDVEAVFINHLIQPLTTVLNDGDQVAFVPPGIPSIHRYNLGFYAAREGRTKDPGAKGPG